jgi:hypothetical protein
MNLYSFVPFALCELFQNLAKTKLMFKKSDDLFCRWIEIEDVNFRFLRRQGSKKFGWAFAVAFNVGVFLQK